MSKCISCGRKGFFFRVNESGRCKDCEKAFQQKCVLQELKEKETAETWLQNIFSKYRAVKEDMHLPDAAIERLAFIPQIEERISECDKLIAEVQAIKQHKSISSVLKRYCHYEKQTYSSFEYACFKAFDIQCIVWKSGFSLADEFQKELIRKISGIKSNWTSTLFHTIKHAEFDQLLLSIPSAKIDYSEGTKIAGTDEEICYSRITSRTNFEKLGDFVSIDVETTGLHASKNEIIEISAIRFENWTPVEKFQSLIKPKKPITPEITQLTGITAEMTETAPSFPSIIQSLASFIGKSNIIGYNLPFDIKFIERRGYDFTICKRKYYDVLEIARSMLKKPKRKWDKDTGTYDIDYESEYDVEDYKLATVCQYHGIFISSAHRATADAFATALLFKELAKEKTGN